MAETLDIISIVSYISSGVFFVVAVVLFFVFRIPSTIGNLCRRGGKKLITNVSKGAKDNEKSVNGSTSEERTTGFISNEGGSGSDSKFVKTGIISNNNAGAESASNGTEMLGNDTMVLENGTTILGESTTVLNKSEERARGRTSTVVFEYIDDIMLIHTEEVV